MPLPFGPIPQTPSAKNQFEENLTELVSIDDQDASLGSRSPARGDDQQHPYRSSRRKAGSKTSPSPQPQPQLQPRPRPSDRLEPPDAFLHRISIGSFSGDGGELSATPLRAFSPVSLDLAQMNGGGGGGGSGGIYREYRRGRRGCCSEPPASLVRVWARHKPVLLVFVAQLVGSLMNLAARLLELEGPDGMHPVQMLFARMVVTTMASCLYMYVQRVPHFPLGAPAVRGLLAVRGLTGFFGIFGMWYSMMYLPLAEATVFTFLAPIVAGYICHVLLHEPFSRKEQLASLLALCGVVLIARPISLFAGLAAGDAGDAGAEAGAGTGAANTTLDAAPAAISALAANVSALAEQALPPASPLPPPSHHPHMGDAVTASQRLMAIAVALLGVLGGSCALTSIRAIGTRAHALISVNYFSTWCTIVTGLVLVAAPRLDIGQPDLQFALPHSVRQWLLLGFVCICGFLTQFLTTMGIGMERSNRATAMVYTHMLFAAGFDRFVFGHQMSIVSLVGCGLIIGSALWAALSKTPTSGKPSAGAVVVGAIAGADIEAGLAMATLHSRHSTAERDDDDDDDDDGNDNDIRNTTTSSSLGDSPYTAGEGIPMLAVMDSDGEEDSPAR